MRETVDVTARDLKRLAAEIKSVRESLGLTQEEFAARGPMSLKTAQRLEWGTVDPRTQTYKKIDNAADWPAGTARSIAESGGTAPKIGTTSAQPTHEWSAAERQKMREMPMAEVQETYEIFRARSAYLADVWLREVMRVKAEAEAAQEATTER